MAHDVLISDIFLEGTRCLLIAAAPDWKGFLSNDNEMVWKVFNGKKKYNYNITAAFNDLYEEPKNLAGVGIVFFKAPDNSLFVKALVQGSSAVNSGIQPGDCLMEVDGKNVYCKGIEPATKAILGEEGSMVKLKLVRIENSRRIPIVANLIRELKATADPEFKVQSQEQYRSGVSTSQVGLSFDRRGDNLLSGVSGMPARARGFSSEPSGRRLKAFREAQKNIENERSNNKGQYTDVFEKDSDGEIQEETISSERVVKYQGKWYTESKIIEMEKKNEKVFKQKAQIESYSLIG
eukprot:760670-Hanusia_phi.AAC.2